MLEKQEMAQRFVGTSRLPAADWQAPDLNRLVRMLAARLLARLPGNCGLEMADLVQAGNVGLMQAQRTFSPASGAHLAGYARFRIRGEMLDTVRRNANCTCMGAAVQGSNSDDGEDLEGAIPASGESSPDCIVARRQRRQILDEEVSRLPTRYRTVVRLRYESDCSLKEIGDQLQVHESRVCQIHRSALGCLKRALARRGVRTISTLM